MKHGNANMDVLIVLGSSSAWLYGVVLFFLGHHQTENGMETHKQVHAHVHHLETACVLISIVSIGKFIEAYSKMKTVSKLSELASLKVTKANLIEVPKQKLKLSSKHREIPVDLL
mmetsp:Transcript_32222/g.49293  ORF Transcript_32222/g.49293 Transcript_32222/m.49293 type:complete len:115 (+) Transcript_32222:855-1199(+)